MCIRDSRLLSLAAFVNKLLSWNTFLPLCRITYGVYLLHPMLMSIVISSRHNGIYIHFTELVRTYSWHFLSFYVFPVPQIGMGRQAETRTHTHTDLSLIHI